MFAIDSHNEVLRRGVCLMVALMIVSSSLTVGAWGALMLERRAVAEFSARV